MNRKQNKVSNDVNEVIIISVRQWNNLNRAYSGEQTFKAIDSALDKRDTKSAQQIASLNGWKQGHIVGASSNANVLVGCVRK